MGTPPRAEAPISLPHAMPDASGSRGVSAFRVASSSSLSATWPWGTQMHEHGTSLSSDRMLLQVMLS